MLYFLQEADPPHRIKLGFSARPERRIAVISAMVPQPLIVLKVMPGDIEDERWLHAHWLPYRLAGKREWYHPVPEILDFISSDLAISA